MEESGLSARLEQVGSGGNKRRVPEAGRKEKKMTSCFDAPLPRL